MTRKLLPRPPAHRPPGRTRPPGVQFRAMVIAILLPSPPVPSPVDCPRVLARRGVACRAPLCLLRTLPPVKVGFVWWFVQACTAVTAGVSGLVACPRRGPPHPAVPPPRPPSPLHAVTPSFRARRKGVKSRDPSPSKAPRLFLFTSSFRKPSHLLLLVPLPCFHLFFFTHFLYHLGKILKGFMHTPPKETS